jgi:hypothetical protein
MIPSRIKRPEARVLALEEFVRFAALDFIRILSGRLPGTGVLSHPLPL